MLLCSKDFGRATNLNSEKIDEISKITPHSEFSIDQIEEASKPILVLCATLYEKHENVSWMTKQMQTYREYGLFSKIVLRLWDTTSETITRRKKTPDFNDYLRLTLDLTRLASIDERRMRLASPIESRIIRDNGDRDDDNDGDYGDDRAIRTNVDTVDKKSRNQSEEREEMQLRSEKTFLILLSTTPYSDSELSSDLRFLHKYVPSARCSTETVTLDIGNGRRDPYVSYLSKVDAEFAISDLRRSDQMLVSYVLPKMQPMFWPSSSIAGGDAKNLVSNDGLEIGVLLSLAICCFHAYLFVFDWFRAQTVPWHFHVRMPRFCCGGGGRITGRLHFKLQRWIVSVHRSVPDEVWNGSRSERFYKNSVRSLNGGGSFHTYNFDLDLRDYCHEASRGRSLLHNVDPSLLPGNAVTHHFRSATEALSNSTSSVLTYVCLVILFLLLTFAISPPGFLDFLSANAAGVGEVMTRGKGFYNRLMALPVIWLLYVLSVFLVFRTIKKGFVFLHPAHYHNIMTKVFVWPSKSGICEDKQKADHLCKKNVPHYLRNHPWLKQADSRASYSDLFYTLTFSVALSTLFFLFPLVYIVAKIILFLRSWSSPIWQTSRRKAYSLADLSEAVEESNNRRNKIQEEVQEVEESKKGKEKGKRKETEKEKEEKKEKKEEEQRSTTEETISNATPPALDEI
jgi:hypothetical protein